MSFKASGFQSISEFELPSNLHCILEKLSKKKDFLHIRRQLNPDRACAYAKLNVTLKIAKGSFPNIAML